jgi:protein-S-isoprenylcysteine O-methyltransferase Ste14
MLRMLRHALSILLLPLLAAAVVPCWLITTFASSDYRWSDTSPMAWLPRSIGAIFFIAGFVLFSWCVSLFAGVGQGTLAPWAPTRNLVAVGPYRFVRNPMISGVTLMLTGQTLLWGSWLVGLWACVFVGLNHIYFVLSEEPGLERRFGEDYRFYKANVPRWIPRLRPWPGKPRPMPG